MEISRGEGLSLGKSSLEKIIFAERLLRQGKPYRIIQDKLQEKFGSGMSNTTLKTLQKKQLKMSILENRIKELEHELGIFKKMYFELKTAIKNRISNLKDVNISVDVKVKEAEKRCNMCNSELPDKAKFCPFCGELNKNEFIK